MLHLKLEQCQEPERGHRFHEELQGAEKNEVIEKTGIGDSDHAGGYGPTPFMGLDDFMPDCRASTFGMARQRAAAPTTFGFSNPKSTPNTITLYLFSTT